MKLKDLLQEDSLERPLRSGGFSREAVGRLSRNFVRVAHSLSSRSREDSPVAAFFVPGRIEVLGKHTDYAGGSSLVCALERGFCLVALPSADATLEVTDVGSGSRVVCEIGRELKAPPGHWSNYVITVARRVAGNFPGSLRGGTLAFLSDLPKSAGMSSSSALMVGLFLVLRTFNNLSRHPAYLENILRMEDLAHYLGCMENGQTFGALGGDSGVGTLGGSEDHTAILCAKPDEIVHYSYAPVRFLGSIPVPPDHLFGIAVSGVTASKTQAARKFFNRLSTLASRAAEAWAAAGFEPAPHLAAIVASRSFSLEKMGLALQAAANAEFPCGALNRRFEHFSTENETIIPAAVRALRSGDLAAFGHLTDQSQEAAERLLGNQIPETTFLAREARKLGATAASAFGAGFGGSVWALIRKARVHSFLNAWRKQYSGAFPAASRNAGFFAGSAGPPAFQLR